jgi:hypothetical protein
MIVLCCRSKGTCLQRYFVSVNCKKVRGCHIYSKKSVLALSIIIVASEEFQVRIFLCCRCKSTGRR